MKSILFFVALAVYVVTAVPVQEKVDHSPYPRFVKIAGADGELQDVDLEAEPDMEALEDVLRNPANNAYYLYTRSNPTVSQLLVMDDIRSLSTSNFNPRIQTVVVAHGWLGSASRGSMYDLASLIKDAYLAKHDVNFIVLDWSRLAWRDYVSAALGTPDVGKGLGQFVRFLCASTGASLGNVHLIGFSLGGHLVGNAGRELDGQIARITALDPAGPLWSLNSNKIKSGDARYVEAIHTDGGYTVGGLGIGSDVGDVDFYVNGGTSQPGCLTNVCNHNRSWEIFAASVTYNHLIGNKCSSSWQVTWNSCRGDQLPMGNADMIKIGSGKYRVNTERRYPY